MDTRWHRNARIIAGSTAFLFLVLFIMLGPALRRAADDYYRFEAYCSANERTKAEKPEEECESVLHRTIRDPAGLFTAGLLLATIALTFATYWLFKAAVAQGEDNKSAIAAALQSADAAKRSAEVAEETLIAGNRPWLRASIRLDRQPVIFSEDGVSTAVAVALQNVGTAPARQVEMDAWLLVYRTEPECDFINEHMRRCKDLLKSTGVATLFPGETFPDVIGSQSFSIGINLNSEEVQAGLAASNGGGVSLYIGGCATYLAPASPERTLKTSFLRRIDRRDFQPLHPSQGLIAAEKITLTPFLFGAGNDAT